MKYLSDDLRVYEPQYDSEQGTWFQVVEELVAGRWEGFVTFHVIW